MNKQNQNEQRLAVIDARSDQSEITVFSISLLERNLRLLALYGITQTVIITNDDRRVKFREDFGRFKPITYRIHPSPKLLIDALKEVPEIQDNTFVLLQGNAIYQEALIDQAIQAQSNTTFVNSQKKMPGLLRLDANALQNLDVSCNDVGVLAAALAENRKISVVDVARTMVYMRNLRKSIHPYAFEVHDKRAASEAESYLFEVTHYGAIDVVAKYFYKVLSKVLVKWIAKTHITPNQITYTSILFAFTVAPLFAFGLLTWGIAHAIVVSILDVCDGKLARFTYRTSDQGDKLDHVADRINIYLYYVGFGIGLKAAGFLDSWQTTFYLISAVVGGHILDKLAASAFRYYHKMRIHDFSPLDGYARLFLPRRNIFIYMMMVGLVIGKPVETYIAYACWMMVYVVFHFGRVIVEKPKKERTN